MENGSQIDSDIFTIVDFSSKIKTLVIYSEDVGKVGTYKFKVSVFYDKNPTEFISTSFQINVLESTPKVIEGTPNTETIA